MPCELEKERDIDEKRMYLEKKEVILVQGVTASQRSDFYIVDLLAEKNFVETPPIQPLLNEGGLGDLVRFGSLLYNFGGETSVGDLFPDLVYGDYHIHVAASCLDLSLLHLHSLSKGDDGLNLVSNNNNNNNNIKWKEAPCMKFPRWGHSCVSLGGKLYTLGGKGKKSEACIGEVLDPQRGYWEELPPPPAVRCCVTSPVIPDEKNGRLLVYLRKVHSLYAYYPSTATWDCLDQNFRCWRERATVMIDDVLYFYTKGAFDCIMAYHLSTRAWLKVVYSSNFPAYISNSHFDGMLNLDNGMMCLCQWLPYNLGSPLPVGTKLRFFKLRVQHTSPGELLVTYDSAKFFSFEGYMEANNFVSL